MNACRPLAQGDSFSIERERLYQRIHRQVPVETTAVEIAGERVPWLRVLDPDQLLENALTRTDRSAEELDPFWAATWRAAIGLDRYLARRPIAGKDVLELGCGSGRAGIAAAMRGARVTLTDAATEGLLVARWNAWGVRDRVKIRTLHWKSGTLMGPKFPWIIGSDIVYDPSLWPLLEPCIARHLEPAGEVLLTEPHRHTGDRFLSWISEAGWDVEVDRIDLGDQQREIRIFSLRKVQS